MGLRDLVLAVTIFGALPFCVAYPWVGILVWSWLGYMNPHRLAFGFAYGFPWASWVAVATLLGVFFTRYRRSLPATAPVLFLLAFWAWMTLTTYFANYPIDAWEQWEKVSKIFLMIVAGLLLMQEPLRVKLLLWVMGLSIGFYGFKGGIFGFRFGGGSSHVLGPEQSFIAGNTEIGLAFTMALPILAFLRRQAPRRWIRHVMGMTFVLTAVATVFTFSRGAILTLAVILPILVLRSRHKIWVSLLLAVGLYGLATVLPPEWFERVETIGTYDTDLSAQGRLAAWRVAIAIAGDHPFLGGGFRTFTREVFERYGDPGGRDAHSIFFQVLGEHGYVGLGLYLALIVATLLALRRLVRTPPADAARSWIPECARMLEVSVLAYLVGGAFLSMSYFDYFYGVVQVAVLLTVLARRPAAAEAPAPPATRAARPVDRPLVVAPR